MALLSSRNIFFWKRSMCRPAKQEHILVKDIVLVYLVQKENILKVEMLIFVMVALLDPILHQVRESVNLAQLEHTL